jgi:hypothetical protein
MTSQPKETTACIHRSDKQEFPSSYSVKQKTFDADILFFNMEGKVAVALLCT